MTNTDKSLHLLKTHAKRLARANRLAHHLALDFVARELGQAHWNALTGAWDKGWRATPAQMDALASMSMQPDRVRGSNGDSGFAGQHVHEQSVTIDGHECVLSSDIVGACIGGYGWSIFVDAAPSIEPTMEIFEHVENNPASDPAFVLKALEIVEADAIRVRERVATDWPRRSTKPDKDGNAVHPLFSNMHSNAWFCLHCDGEFASSRMAENMWHCPTCSATPIDIFPAPFWRGAA